MGKLKTINRLKLDFHGADRGIYNMTDIVVDTHPASDDWVLNISIHPQQETLQKAAVILQTLMLNHPEYETPFIIEAIHFDPARSQLDPLTFDTRKALRHPSDARLDGTEIQIVLHQAGPYAKDAATWKAFLIDLWRELSQAGVGFGNVLSSTGFVRHIMLQAGQYEVPSCYTIGTIPETGELLLNKKPALIDSCPIADLSFELYELLHAGIKLSHITETCQLRERMERTRLTTFETKLNALCIGELTDASRCHPSSAAFAHAKAVTLEVMQAFCAKINPIDREDEFTPNRRLEAAFLYPRNSMRIEPALRALPARDDKVFSPTFTLETLQRHFCSKDSCGGFIHEIATEQRKILGSRGGCFLEPMLNKYFAEPTSLFNALITSLSKIAADEYLKTILPWRYNDQLKITTLVCAKPFLMQLLSRQLVLLRQSHRSLVAMNNNHKIINTYVMDLAINYSLAQAKRSAVGLQFSKCAKIEAFVELHADLVAADDFQRFCTIFRKWDLRKGGMIRRPRWAGEPESGKVADEIKLILDQ